MGNRKFTLITGASEGLGRCFALECARMGRNLILVALPGSGLPQLADHIRRQFDVTVYLFEKDLTLEESCFFISGQITADKLAVNMLINNAGIGNTGTFEEGSVELYEREIKLNVLATTLLTRLLIQNLKENGPAHILNVGSLASIITPPKKPVYAATKAFILSFTLSLKKELKKDNITVCALCPGGLNTNLNIKLLIRTGTWLSRLSVLNPEEAAAKGLKGLLKGKKIIVPGILNHLALILNKILPEFIKNLISGYLMKNTQPRQLSYSQLIVNSKK